MAARWLWLLALGAAAAASPPPPPPPPPDAEVTFVLPAGRRECFYQAAPGNASMETEYQYQEGSRLGWRRDPSTRRGCTGGSQYRQGSRLGVRGVGGPGRPVAPRRRGSPVAGVAGDRRGRPGRGFLSGEPLGAAAGERAAPLGRSPHRGTHRSRRLQTLLRQLLQRHLGEAGVLRAALRQRPPGGRGGGGRRRGRRRRLGRGRRARGRAGCQDRGHQGIHRDDAEPPGTEHPDADAASSLRGARPQPPGEQPGPRQLLVGRQLGRAGARGRRPGPAPQKPLPGQADCADVAGKHSEWRIFHRGVTSTPAEGGLGTRLRHPWAFPAGIGAPRPHLVPTGIKKPAEFAIGAANGRFEGTGKGSGIRGSIGATWENRIPEGKGGKVPSPRSSEAHRLPDSQLPR